MEEVPEFGAVFTFGKSKFGDNNANKFWVKNDPVVAVACGDEHTAVVTSSGRAYTFGSNQWGQLALSHTNQTNKPSFVKSLKGRPITHIACGRSHTLFATKDEVYACGGNGEHQVNSSSDDEVLTPYLIPSLSGISVKRLSCGVEHSLILGHRGNVYLWGSGSEGQLGMGPNVTELLTPTILQFTEENIKDASCGYYHSGILTQSGKIFTFGEGESGKLGLGDDCDDSYNTPQPVFFVDSAERICCGNTCTAVMTTAGALYMSGDGQRGQLGFAPNSLNKCIYTLTKVPCPPIVDVAVGEGHTAVVSKSGHLYTFGDGRHGKLCHGDDNFSNLHSPYLVQSFSTIATVQKVSCGGCHTMVIAKPGRPQDEVVKVSTARSKRHLKGSRLNENQEPSSIPLIKSSSISVVKSAAVDNNKENHNTRIVQENVKSLESALGETPAKIVALNDNQKQKEPDKRHVKKERESIHRIQVKSNHNNVEKKKSETREEKKKLQNLEEESGSETDEPGATSDVTDSEATEEEDSGGGGGGFMDNIMSIEELQPAGPVQNHNIISVQSSTVPVNKSAAPAASPVPSKPRGPITGVNRNKTASSDPASTKLHASSGPASTKLQETSKVTKLPTKPVLEESSEYETETDEEGEDEDESEEEEEEEEGKKKEEPKTLVSQLPPDSDDSEKKKTASEPKAEVKEDPTKNSPQKPPSKFKFWKKKSKKEEPVVPETPGNQNNSKACIIL